MILKCYLIIKVKLNYSLSILLVARDVLVNSNVNPKNIGLINIRISGYLFSYHYQFNAVEPTRGNLNVR